MSEIEGLMTADVITVKRQTPIVEVIETLLANDVTGLPVVNDDGTMAGIISEKDVLGLLSDSENTSAVAEDFMTEHVVGFDVEGDLIEICESLIKNPFRRVPILRDNKIAGIISRRDIIRYILEPIG